MYIVHVHNVVQCSVADVELPNACCTEKDTGVDKKIHQHYVHVHVVA